MYSKLRPFIGTRSISTPGASWTLIPLCHASQPSAWPNWYWSAGIPARALGDRRRERGRVGLLVADALAGVVEDEVRDAQARLRRARSRRRRSGPRPAAPARASRASGRWSSPTTSSSRAARRDSAVFIHGQLAAARAGGPPPVSTGSATARHAIISPSRARRFTRVILPLFVALKRGSRAAKPAHSRARGLQYARSGQKSSVEPPDTAPDRRLGLSRKPDGLQSTRSSPVRRSTRDHSVMADAVPVTSLTTLTMNRFESLAAPATASASHE